MAARSDRQLSIPLPKGQEETPPRARKGPKAKIRPERAARQVVARKDERERLLEQASALAQELSLRLSERVHLTITDNTSTMVSFRRDAGSIAFRVHQMFLDAPGEVVDALADYAARRRRTAGAVLDAFVKTNEHRVRRSRAEKQARSLDPFGRIHDLQAIYDELNATYFGGRIEAGIGWGREAPDRRRRSIKMGTYFHDSKVIRIHPALDRPEVPEFFVAFVVFHEMLHQAVPPRIIGGRRIAHTPEFRALEAAYPDYDRALAWESRNLSLLLGEGRRRRPHFDPDDPLA